MLLLPIICGLGLVFGFSSIASAELIAARITAENFSTHHVGGPDADAGIDDWFLSNGSICAAVSDPGHESAVTPFGGVLTDVGHCGASDDQFVVLQPMLNLSQSHVVPITEIEAGQDPGRAWLRTRASFVGIELITTYTVTEARPLELDITTQARRLESGDSFFSIGLILLHTSGQTPVFSLLRSDLDRSVGFAYPETDRRSLTSLLSALIATDLTVLVGSDGMPPISYGLERLSSDVLEAGKRIPLASFSVSGMHFTFVNSLTRPLWWGENDQAPSILQLAQIPFMDVPDETVLETQYRIHVGARADVASITDQIWKESRRVRGQVDDPEARVHIDRASGAPMTEIRPNSDGRFELNLPPGAYTARVLAPGDRTAEAQFEVAPSGPTTEIPPLSLEAPARIKLPHNFIGRLTFLSQETGNAAVFGSNLLGQRMGDQAIPSGTEAPFLNLAGSSIDPEDIAIAPGHYRVVAVRGPEYEARELKIVATPGTITPLELAPLARVAPTPGWLGADFHVHSGESFDSALPQPLQVVAFAASGAEVLVATEHDRVFDPQPAILATGLNQHLVGVTGVEVTSAYEGGDSPYASGHLNAFPYTAVPAANRGGAPSLEGRRIRDALVDIAAAPQNTLKPFVQMNHPRPGPNEQEGDTYFSHLGVAGIPFDPTLPLSEAPNNVLIEKNPRHGGRDLDYHGVEIMNGQELIRYRRVRADWFNLMLQGERIIATANSDSHRLGVIVGLPRTYVAVKDDRIETFDQGELMASLRKGAAWGTTGPLLQVHLGETPLGGLHTGESATLHIRVDAAPWVPLSEWRAYVNGELVHRAPIKAGESADLPLVFAKDSFVTVEVEGPREGLYAEALPEFTPFAFTNPIFVDADSSGAFDAPGLPRDLPTTLTQPDKPD